MEDVLLVNSIIAGGEHSGSIVGCVDNAQIANCRVESSVTLRGEESRGYVAGQLMNGAKVLGCVSDAKGDGNTETFDIAGSKDETSVVQHSLYMDSGHLMVGSQPAFRVINQIPQATIKYGTPTANYSVSNIIAYEKGISYTGQHHPELL